MVEDNKEADKFTVLDLFCGCGGLSLGFYNARYNILLGVDNNETALRTFRENHGHAESMNLDLSKEKCINDIRKKIGDHVDVIVAGPPCQGFSLTGPRNFDDPRNKLYLSVIKAVKTFRPEAFIIENVPGLATLYGGKIKNEITRRFMLMDYNVVSNVICSADYGVPQLRRRIFLVGMKKKYGEYRFPNKTNTEKNYITCSEAISDLPSREKELGQEVDDYDGEPLSDYQIMMRKGSRKLYNHVATNHTEMVKKIISLVPEGGNYRDLPKGVGENRRFHEAWTRYHSKKPSKTIDTGHRNHFHYKYNRIPTIREMARLQSFPDRFIFYGNRSQQNGQVGNAVPPLLAENLARQLLTYLDGRRKEKWISIEL